MNSTFCAALLSLWLCSWGEALAQRAHTPYQAFHAWRSLVPELPAARVCNLTMAGHELWAQGQLRMPAEAFLHGDLRHSGSEDWAVPLADGDAAASCAYVLLATRAPDGWQRLLLQPVWLEDSVSGFSLVWNAGERAIGIDFGKRRRHTSRATLVWQDGRVLESKAGYVLELAVISQVIVWVDAQARFEYRRLVPPEEWDLARP